MAACLPPQPKEAIMKLYFHPVSGHAHRARLFLSLIGADADIVEVDLAAGEHKSPEYLAKNRFGQVPILEDDGAVIADSNAIMVYAAKKFGRSDWLPEDPAGAAAVQRWLSVAAGQIAFGPAAARLVTIFNAGFNPEEVIARAHAVLALIEAELEGREWIAADHATIADIALYSYIASAPEGNVDLSSYANVNAWLARIEALPGFVEFAKNPVGLNA
jgi:glutathione S-transferase